MNAEKTNAEQIEFWNGKAGQKWADFQPALDTMMDPLGLQAIQEASPGSEDHVLDVGCGCGSTSMQLSQLAAKVTGIDISGPMLEIAKSRLASDGVTFELADAAVHSFQRNSFDLIFSRFGVMFFADPVAAFSNLRTSLKAHGRLCFLCWRAIDENPWMMVPLTTVLQFVSPPEPAQPGSPGPFAFADVEHVRSILEQAEFQAIEFKPLDSSISVGTGEELQESLTFLEKIGPVAALIADQSQQVIAQIRAALLTTLKEHQTPEGIRMGAACWIVSAQNGVA